MPHSVGTGPIDRDGYPGPFQRTPSMSRTARSTLSCPHGVKAAGGVAQLTGVDRAHLVDEYAGPGPVQLDLRPEDRRLRAGGSRSDNQHGKQDSVT